MCSSESGKNNTIIIKTNKNKNSTLSESEIRRQFWLKVIYLYTYVEKTTSNLEEKRIEENKEKYLLTCRFRIFRLFLRFRKFNLNKKLLEEKERSRKYSHLSLVTMNFSRTMKKFHSCGMIKGK